ncbi:MAG TPA: hypothetical protein VKH46_17325 [Thermoanaerobaculia bacterium]|nr:hypothetical protein [Thermoanaerobaculia bacterium]
MSRQRPIGRRRPPALAAAFAMLLGLAAAAPAAAPPAAPAILADVVLDPNAPAILADAGDLRAHYAVPIVEGGSVYTEVKGGAYTHSSEWETQAWGVRRWDWKDGALVESWTRWSDWTPVPYAQFGTNPYGSGPLWEPVFQPAARGDFLYVPGAGGTIDEIRKEDGALSARIRPFGTAPDPRMFLTGPVVSSDAGVYFNVIALDAENPWNADTPGSWLVRIAPGGAVSTLAYADLSGAPAADAACEIAFPTAQLPFPPSRDASPPTIPCGSPRPAVGAGPAVGDDGTVYAVARSHFDGRWGWVVALGPDLGFRWAASLRNRLADGCGFAVPPTGGPGGCREGALPGVDPETNQMPAAIVDDSSSAAPVPTPDGSVLYGAATRYNFAQGHLMKFGTGGTFLGSYGFGWDTTPAVYAHDGTYAILLKENRYDVGAYCGFSPFCPASRAAIYPDDPDAYFVTRLDPSLAPEWRFRNTNTQSCSPRPDGSLACVADHPRGFELCVSLVAVGEDGSVYANAEDGNLYAIGSGGALRGRVFLESAEGAAYTPVVLADGVVYAQNLGHLIAVDASAMRGCAPPGAPSAGRPPICAGPTSSPALVEPRP